MKHSFIHFFAFLSLLISQPNAKGAVNFIFDYSASTDFTGSSSLAVERRASLEAVAALVGSWFKHTNSVTIAVTSSNDPNSTFLATAGSNYTSAGTPGFTYQGFVQKAILTGTGAPSGPDGTVNVNFGVDWDLDDSVSANAFDFKAVMIHELLHAAGFLSEIEQNGNMSGSAPGTPTEATLFDKYVTDAAGNPVINRSTFSVDGILWGILSTGGGTETNPQPNGLYFSGPQAMAANGGMPVRIFSPSPWQQGSSGSHLDDFFYGSVNLAMKAVSSFGPGPRGLTAFEVGILKDIGYDMFDVPTITSSTTASGYAGESFQYQITATEGATSAQAEGLPTGLSINPSTGLISGTPSQSGTSSVTLSATNTVGTNTLILTLTIFPNNDGAAARSWYSDADFYYGYFAGLGQMREALAYWFYFRALGDQASRNFKGETALAYKEYYQGLAYFYYTFLEGQYGRLYFYYLYIGYSEYTYRLAIGDSEGASIYFNYYLSLANSFL